MYATLTGEQRRSLMEAILRESELPLGNWVSMTDARRDTMPSAEKIRDYWSDIMQYLNKFDSRQELGESVCWMCGMAAVSLERAHILSWQEGGSSEPSNFHLLHHSCHRLTEDLTGEAYWEIFLVTQSMVYRMITFWKGYSSSAKGHTVTTSRQWWDASPQYLKDEADSWRDNRVPYKWLEDMK